MELSVNPSDNVVIVSIQGEIDSITGPELGAFFKEQLTDQKNLIANFSKVGFLSTAGLRVLLATIKETRQAGGDLRLAKVQEEVYNVLKISGFTRIMKIYPDIDSAVESFSE